MTTQSGVTNRIGKTLATLSNGDPTTVDHRIGDYQHQLAAKLVFFVTIDEADGGTFTVYLDPGDTDSISESFPHASTLSATGMIELTGYPPDTLIHFANDGGSGSTDITVVAL